MSEWRTVDSHVCPSSHSTALWSHMVKVELVRSDGIPKGSEGRRGEAACLGAFELDTGGNEVSYDLAVYQGQSGESPSSEEGINAVDILVGIRWGGCPFSLCVMVHVTAIEVRK